MTQQLAVRLKPVVHFREFPFGTSTDPSMRESMATQPWQQQDKVLAYLRSGHVVAYPMGASLTDWFDRTRQANPVIAGHPEGGATPMTDGVWLWPAGLIYFIERYNVRLPEEFVAYAASQKWRIDREQVSRGIYEYDY